MTIRVEAVDAGFAPEASAILREAWSHQSAIDYTPEYLAWQFSFPGPLPPVAFAAFEGAEPIGFLGATVRHFRLGKLDVDAFCSSFWGMLVGRGGAGGALLLLDALLTALWSYRAPVLGFGVHNDAVKKYSRTCSSVPASSIGRSAVCLLMAIP